MLGDAFTQQADLRSAGRQFAFVSKDRWHLPLASHVIAVNRIGDRAIESAWQMTAFVSQSWRFRDCGADAGSGIRAAKAAASTSSPLEKCR